MQRSPEIRRLKAADHAQIVALYNHYVTQTAATFDLVPFTLETRLPWFAQFHDDPRHICIIAADGDDVLGYANSGRFRPKDAYLTSVETSIYLRHDQTGRGLGRRLYGSLFEALADKAVHRAYAAITLPNRASISLHQSFGFKKCGLLSEVGFKFGRYRDVQWMEKAL